MARQGNPTLDSPSAGAFKFLRWTVAGVVVAASSAAAAIFLPFNVTLIVLTVEVFGLLVAGMLVEFMLYKTERELLDERDEMKTLWQQEHTDLMDVATRDELTQLQNRRFYYERLHAELEQATSRGTPLSLLMIDVDDLKGINDEFGHLVGDIVLRKFASVLNGAAGEVYATARLGGDEFAVIMPGADRREADRLSERVWRQLAEGPVYETDHASIYLGVSIGTSGYPWGGTSVEEITQWADTKMYANKLARKGVTGARGDMRENRLAGAVVEVLSTALDIRDKMTHRHAQRVARTAAAVARGMHLSTAQVSEIEYAASLHDIGKIGVPDGILRKSAPLDDDEWMEMRRHSELGYQILKGIDFFKDAADIVYAHHEHYDGTGYPRGLIHDEIPLGARVFAVVDAYDAMTSRRPYRDAMTRERALREIAHNAGTQFDPKVVETFLTVVRLSADGFYEESEHDADSAGEAATSPVRSSKPISELFVLRR